MGEAPWRQYHYQCSRRAGRLHLTIAIIACLDVAMWITWLWDIIVCCHPKFVMGAHQSFFCRQIWMRIMHLCWKPNEGEVMKRLQLTNKISSESNRSNTDLKPSPLFCWGLFMLVISDHLFRYQSEHWTVYPSYLSFLLHLNIYIWATPKRYS